MATLIDVRKRTQALLGDPDGDWATPAYLDSFINDAYESQILYLKTACSPFITVERELPGVPAGTVDLLKWMVDGQPFAGLLNPLGLDWKQTGQPETSYVPAAGGGAVLPDVSPLTGYGPGIFGGGLWYAWRSYGLYVTPMSMVVDLRLRGEFFPSPLLKETDAILAHPQMVSALAKGTAAMVGIERGNEGYAENWGTQAMATLDDIAADLIRSGQGARTRLGRVTGWRGRR